MKKIILIIILLGVITPSGIFAQKNRISIYTGLFHEYFDKSKMVEIIYNNENKLKRVGVPCSYGFQYTSKINSKSSWSFTASGLFYHWNYPVKKMLRYVIWERKYFTININYERVIPLTEKLFFTYGGGINYRIGNISIIASNGYIGQSMVKEMLLVSRGLNDFALNLRTGIEYTPIKWLTLYTKFNFIGFIYLDNLEDIRGLKDHCDCNTFPKYFDLSWRFGIGFNFGK